MERERRGRERERRRQREGECEGERKREREWRQRERGIGRDREGGPVSCGPRSIPPFAGVRVLCPIITAQVLMLKHVEM